MTIINCDDCKEYDKGVEQLREELIKHRWIPVSERLPEDGVKGFYIVIAISGLPYSAYQYKNEVWMNKEGERMQIITHWKPIILPESEVKK